MSNILVVMSEILMCLSEKFFKFQEQNKLDTLTSVLNRSCGEYISLGMGDLRLKLPFLFLFFKCISYGMDLHWARINRPSFYKDLDEATESGAYKVRLFDCSAFLVVSFFQVLFPARFLTVSRRPVACG